MLYRMLSLTLSILAVTNAAPTTVSSSTGGVLGEGKKVEAVSTNGCINHQTCNVDADCPNGKCVRHATPSCWCPNSTRTPTPTSAPILPNTLYSIKGNHHDPYKYHNHKYCAADDTKMTCNRAAVGPWEKYTLELQGNGLYAIKSNRFKTYCSDSDPHSEKMVCDRTTIGDWEQFAIEPLPNVGVNDYAIRAGIRTRDGQRKYCSDQGDKIRCNVARRQGWEIFEITPA